MKRKDPKSPLLIHESWIGIYLRKASQHTMMFQDYLNVQLIGIANYPQLTSETKPH